MNDYGLELEGGLEEEGSERVGAEIWRVPLRTPTLPPATHTNAYVLTANRGAQALWVEPASPFAPEIERALCVMDSLERAGYAFAGYLLTHHHADHVGGLAAMLKAKPLPVWAHPETHRRVPIAAATPRLHIEEKELPCPFESWTAVHTPGHAPGHLCLWRGADAHLLAGDMVAGVGSILVDPADGDMAVYLESLHRLDALSAQKIFPAHGPVIAAERDIFRTYIEHRLMREEKVLAALIADVPRSLQELLSVSYNDTPRQLWSLAELSLVAHLQKLQKEGRARFRDEGWVRAGG